MKPDCATCDISPFWMIWDSSPFVPRYECGDWPGWQVAAWVVPSVLLFLFYMEIARQTWSLWRRSTGTYPSWPLPWIAAFFVGCAGGHLFNALAFTWPAYRAYILWDWYTLAASVVGYFGVNKIRAWASQDREQTVRERDAAVKRAKLVLTALQTERAKAHEPDAVECWGASRMALLDGLIATLGERHQ